MSKCTSTLIRKMVKYCKMGTRHPKGAPGLGVEISMGDKDLSMDECLLHVSIQDLFFKIIC